MIRVMLSFLLVSTANAATVDLSQGRSKVEFLAVGQPSALKIRGKAPEENKNLDGKLSIDKAGLSGNASFKMDQLNTGVDMRDTHMKEKYLEVQKFPTSQIKFTAVPLPSEVEKPDFKHEGPFEAELTLHGVTKKVKGDLDLKKAAEKYNGHFKFELNLEDFGIEIPSYLGIKVAKTVKVEVGFYQ